MNRTQAAHGRHRLELGGPRPVELVAAWLEAHPDRALARRAAR